MPSLEDIEDFYHTPLGKRVKAALDETTIFKNFIGNNTSALMIGYGVPYLDNIDSNQQKNIVLSSLASLGYFCWPHGENNRCVHCDEAFMPFADQSFDRVVVIHGLEHTYNATALMKEVWRILNGNGKLLLIIPNRASVWSRREKTPFAYGLPYSFSQISSMLKTQKYFIEKIEYGLRFLPISRFLPLNWVLGIERWGRILHLPFGGVLIISAGKRLYAPRGKKDKALDWKIRALKWGSLSSS